MQPETHTNSAAPQASILSRACAAATSVLLALSLSVLGGAPAPAYADTAADKQAEAQEALARLNAMQDSLDKASADYGEALAAQEAAEQARDNASARIDQINEELAIVQERLGNRARDMYRSGSSSVLDLLLGATTFTEFTTNWDLLGKMNNNDAALVQEERSLRAEAEEQHAVYATEAQTASAKAQEAADVQAQAEATVAEMQATYDGLSAEAQQLLEEERAARAAAEAAQAQAVVNESANQARGNEGGADPAPAPTPDPTPAPEPPSQSYEGGSDVVSRAYACLGAPYVWGAVGPYGYDCSGLVSYCLTGTHSRLGTTYTFMGWRQVSDPQPGDVCTNWGHCGIYIGGGQMIHAADYGVGVIVGPVQSGMIIVRY